MKSKKALAIVLAIAMLFGVVSMASAASSLAPKGFADSQDSKQADAIAYLKAFGVLRGDAGTNNVRPGDALTREEFVTIVVRATGYEALASGLAGFKPNFTDAAQISDWAVGPVNFATGQGWIKGYEDGTFRPKGNLTMAEAITVLVRATGHELNVPSTAVWPVGHILQAQHRGISTGVTVNANAPITREDMARLTYNSLFVATAYVGDDGKVKNDGDRLAEAYLIDGTIVSVDVEDQEIVLNYGDPVANHTHALADEVALFGANSFAGLNGLTVRATLNADGEIIILEIGASQAAGTYVLKGTDTKDGKRNLVMTDGTVIKTQYSTDPDKVSTTFTINKDDYTPGSDAALENLLKELADFPGSDVIVTVKGGVAESVTMTVMWDFDWIVVDVDTDAKTVTVRYYTDFIADDDTNDEVLDVVDGSRILLGDEAVALSAIKVNDVVAFALDEDAGNNNVVKLAAHREVLSGKHTSVVAKLIAAGKWQAESTVEQADKTKRTVRWNFTGANAGAATTGLPGTADTDPPVHLLLNARGEAVADIGEQAQKAFVKAVSIYSIGGTEYVDFVDLEGNTLSLKSGGGFAIADLNTVGEVTFKGDTFSGTGLSYVKATWGAEVEITNIIGDVILYQSGGTTRAIGSPTVYQWADGNKAGDQLSIDDLKVGDKIVVSTNFEVVLKK